MTEDEFWALVEECRADSHGDLSAFTRCLKQRLSALPPEQILSFSSHWYAASDAARTWPVWDAARVLLGWVIDEPFADYRAWLIAQGRASFEAVVADPDNLADLAGRLLAAQWAVVEEIDPIVRRGAYEAATGERPPVRPGDADGCATTAGERIDLDDDRLVQERFPRLWQRRQRLGRSH